MAALSSSTAAQKQGTRAELLSYPHNWLGRRLTLSATRKRRLFGSKSGADGLRVRGQNTCSLLTRCGQLFNSHTLGDRIQAKLAQDRIGVARPYPFGGSHHWEWIVDNSERLFGKGSAEASTGKGDRLQSWLVASAEVSPLEAGLAASHLASAMVALNLHAVRKGTVMPLSSLMLASSFEDHLSWVHHLDPIDHPAAVANRTSTGPNKVDKHHLKSLIERRCEIMQLGRSAPSSSSHSKKALLPDNVWIHYTATAADPEELHHRTADWNNAVGTVLDGDYSLGNGRGFGIGAVTLRAWVELQERERRLGEMKGEGEKGRRRARNPVETRFLLLMREPGTDVVRAVSASRIPLM